MKIRLIQRFGAAESLRCATLQAMYCSFYKTEVRKKDEYKYDLSSHGASVLYKKSG